MTYAATVYNSWMEEVEQHKAPTLEGAVRLYLDLSAKYPARPVRVENPDNYDIDNATGLTREEQDEVDELMEKWGAV